MNEKAWERRIDDAASCLPVDVRHDSQNCLQVEFDAVQVAVFFDKSGINNDHQLDNEILGRVH